jgi:hypothetical protein
MVLQRMIYLEIDILSVFMGLLSALPTSIINIKMTENEKCV